MESALIQWLRSDNFQLFPADYEQCPLRNARRFAVCICQLHNPLILEVLDHFPEGTTSGTRWFVFERMKRVKKGMVHSPFNTETMGKHFRTVDPNVLIFDMDRA